MKRYFFTTALLSSLIYLNDGFASPVFTPKVIYNEDTRQEIALESPTDIMQFVQKRTLAIVHSADFHTQPSGDIIFLPRHYGRAFKLCEDERFYNQPSLAKCTASVIGKDLILTAGHCVSESGCQFTRFLSDFVLGENGENPIRTTTENIYRCKKIIYENDNPASDMAIVQLDREFPHSPLNLAEAPLTLQDEILAVGHPSGLPMKSSGLGPIRKFSGNLITAELETFGGNSGSPVFKKNSSVIEGILVAGETDFVLSENKKCYKTNVCTSTSCSGEDITSAQFIRSVLNRKLFVQDHDHL